MTLSQYVCTFPTFGVRPTAERPRLAPRASHPLFAMNIFVFTLLVLFNIAVYALNTNSRSEIARNKLVAALSSPSGKLTLSPEVIIPEPKDATSILLLTNAVETVSERVRSCNSNVAFVRGSIAALRTFTNEQASALGNFPGPIPTIYCPTDKLEGPKLEEIAAAGADGVLIDLCSDEFDSIDHIASTTQSWVDLWEAAVAAGIQPIPEVAVGESKAALWGDDELNSLASIMIDASGMEPAAIVLTINPTTDNMETEGVRPPNIPSIPKSLSKRIPILGSLSVPAGEDRLQEETLRFKEAGYSGAFLRGDCVPGFHMQPNLEIVGKFWYACICDLKSTRSKSFSFRAKNKLEVSSATKWGNYQKSVIESGALGDPSETASLNEAAGDYQGFA
jgi:hypothetical protein